MKKKRTIGVLLFAANEFHRYSIDHLLKAARYRRHGLNDLAAKSEEKAKVNRANERIVQEEIDELSLSIWQRFRRGFSEWAKEYGEVYVRQGPFFDL